MRSFIPALISVALASFIGAAPLHGNHPASVPDISIPSKFPSVLQSSSNPAIGGQLGSVKGEVGNVAQVRDLQSQIKGAVNSIASKLNARTSSSSSLPAILANMTAEIQSCAAELNYLNPMNMTATIVENTFLAMEKLVNEAIYELELLTGENLLVILDALDGADAEFAASEVSDSVLNIFDMIYDDTENAYKTADTKGSSSSGSSKAARAGVALPSNVIRHFIKDVLPGFTKAVDSLVPGLDTASFLTMFSPLLLLS